eukprot:TCALIF_09688-PA protein Name:"Similar to TGFBI Transforming growth factor-beta-induced protein ig-h3 (Homo sapiens)" AED:0.24 eAED:0.24 QI:0/0/0/0.6/1/1/5/0/402
MIRVCQVALALALVLSVHGYSSKGKPNLVQLAKQLGLSEFVERLEDSAIDHIINHEGFFTIFAPSNDAFKNEMTYPDEAPIKSKMLFHIGRGKIYAKDIKNEMTVKSLLSKRRIRLNTYSNGKVTANGRVISSTDHEARNGVIHIIDDVMSSVYDRAGSIVSELDDCCPQHSIVLGLIKDAKLYDKLNTRGPLTFLAPNNGAFNELHPDFIIHLKKNITALRTFIAGHVLPGTLYSPGLQDGMMVKTFRGNQVKVTIAGNGKMAFNDAQVTLPDVTAGNGAVQAIDAILSPHKKWSKFLKPSKTATKKGLKNLVQGQLEIITIIGVLVILVDIMSFSYHFTFNQGLRKRLHTNLARFDEPLSFPELGYFHGPHSFNFSYSAGQFVYQSLGVPGMLGQAPPGR